MNIMILIKKIGTFWGFVKFTFLLGLIVIVSFLVLMLLAHSAAKSAGEGVLYTDAAMIPDEGEKRVALVLGCSEKIHGRTNLYFKYRIAAAYKLWEAGKVRGFIMSGDNSKDDYNEPEDMKRALVGLGVPADKIVCDYAGLRTMDSVVRVAEIFEVKRIILVSQKFHNERAAYIAQSRGIDALGMNAQDVKGKEMSKREHLARIRMWADENVLKTTPKYLGDKVTLTF